LDGGRFESADILALDLVSGGKILTISLQVQISRAQKAAMPHQSNI
jgi:hypothetical protein